MQLLIGVQQQQTQDPAPVFRQEHSSEILIHLRRQLSPFLHRYTSTLELPRANPLNPIPLHHVHRIVAITAQSGGVLGRERRMQRIAFALPIVLRALHGNQG